MNQRRRKIVSIILSIAMCVMTFSGTQFTYAETEELIASGTSGNLTWSIDANGLLTISGTGNGEKTYYSSQDSKSLHPWHEYRDSVVKAVIDVDRMTDASYFFLNCTNLTTVDISNWDTSRISDMSYMFSGCTSLSDIDISNLKTDYARNMKYMFRNCDSLKEVDMTKWNVSYVDTMSNMFCECNNLKTVKMSGLNMPRLSDMTYMFYNCTGLTDVTLENVNTKRLENTSDMFKNCSSLEKLDLSDLDTEHLRSISYMFEGCKKLTDMGIANWDTASITNMSNVFDNCDAVTTFAVSAWDTSNVYYMDNMFYNCDKLKELDLSGWDTGNVVSMYQMFAWDRNLRTINAGSWDTGSLLSIGNMFYYCNILKGDITFSNAISSYSQAFENAAINQDASFTVYYNDKCTEEIAKAVVDTKSANSNITMEKKEDTVVVTPVVPTTDSAVHSGQLGGMYWMIDSNGHLSLTGTGDGVKRQYQTPMYPWLEYKSEIKTATVDVVGLKDMSYFFYDCDKMVSAEAVDVSQVTDMSYVFYDCSKLTSVNTGGWDVSNVTSFYNMFNYCQSLKTLDVSKWNTSKVKDMRNLFYNCSELKSVDVSKWDTGNVTQMSRLFSYCSKLEMIDVSDWDTTMVEEMEGIFNNCRAVEALDVSKWDTSIVTTMEDMFMDCDKLTTLDLSKWDTSCVINAGNMFRHCNELETLDITNWKCLRLEDANNMFSYCRNLSCEFKVYNEIDIIEECFLDAATNYGAQIYISYEEENEWLRDTVEALLDSKADDSNVYVKNKENLSKENTKITLAQSVYETTGEAARPKAEVTYNGTKLTEGTDYKVTYANNEDIGEAAVMIRGMGKYAGEVSASYYIVGYEELQLTATDNKDGTVTVNVYGAFCHNALDLGLMYDNTQVMPVNVSWRTVETDSDAVSKETYLFENCSGTFKQNYQFVSLQGNSTIPVIWNSNKEDDDKKEICSVNFMVKDNATLAEFAISTDSNKDVVKLENAEGTILKDVAEIVTSCSIVPTTKAEVEYKKEGTIGNIQWTLTESGHLSISGNGNTGVNNYKELPWYEERFDIMSADISVTNMTDAKYLFYGCREMQWVDVSQWDVSKITDMTSLFDGCMNLESINCNNWDTSKLTNVTEMFAQCSSLSCEITFAREIENLTGCFKNAALEGTAQIIVDYTDECTRENALSVVNTRSKYSNVILKGESLLPLPEASQEPEVSASPNPEVSSKPGSSANPGASINPGVSTSPKPEASSSPNPGSSASSKPSTSSPNPDSSTSPNPDASNIPEASGNPNASQQPGHSIMPGDVNDDNQVTLSDAQTVLKAALKIINLDGDYAKAADVDEDGEITLSDAQKILKYALKIINEFTVKK